MITPIVFVSWIDSLPIWILRNNLVEQVDRVASCESCNRPLISHVSAKAATLQTYTHLWLYCVVRHHI